MREGRPPPRPSTPAWSGTVKTWTPGPSPRRRGFGPAGGTSPGMTSFAVRPYFVGGISPGSKVLAALLGEPRRMGHKTQAAILRDAAQERGSSRMMAVDVVADLPYALA